MAQYAQQAPYQGGILRWVDDDTDFSKYPVGDAAQSLGTRANRVLVNYAFPVTRLFQTTAAGAAYGNATAETSVLGTKTGPGYPGASAAGTIPASFLNRVGSSIRFHAEGIIANTGTPNLTWTVYLGATAVLTSGVVATATITGTLPWFLDGSLTTLTTGGAGTVIGQGTFRYFTTAPVGVTWALYNAAAVTVALDASKAIDVKATWGTQNVSNTLTCQYAYADVVL